MGRSLLCALVALKGTDDCFETRLLENLDKFIWLNQFLLGFRRGHWALVCLDSCGNSGTLGLNWMNSLLSGLALQASSAICV